MKLFRTVVWKPIDVALLKWCCLLFGMLFGSFVPTFIKRHGLLFTIIAAVLAIKPAITYFSGEEVLPSS